MKKFLLIFSILILIALLWTGINQKINHARDSTIYKESRATVYFVKYNI